MRFLPSSQKLGNPLIFLLYGGKASTCFRHGELTWNLIPGAKRSLLITSRWENRWLANGSFFALCFLKSHPYFSYTQICHHLLVPITIIVIIITMIICMISLLIFIKSPRFWRNHQVFSGEINLPMAPIAPMAWSHAASRQVAQSSFRGLVSVEDVFEAAQARLPRGSMDRDG